MATTFNGNAFHAAEATNGTSNGSHSEAFNYAAFRSPGGGSRIGSLDIESGKITPLAYRSGTYIQTLYEVIEAGPAGITTSGDALSVADLELLPPISGRDVLAVGKNYAVSVQAQISKVFAHLDSRSMPKSSTPQGRPMVHLMRIWH